MTPEERRSKLNASRRAKRAAARAARPPKPLCFTRQTALMRGVNKRTIERELRRGEKLGPLQLRIIKTSLDRVTEMEALIVLLEFYPDVAKHVVERAVAGEKISAKEWLRYVKSIDQPE